MLRLVHFLAIFPIISCLAAQQAYAQTSAQKIITIQADNLPVGDVLDMIEEQAGISFSYNSKLIKTSQKVSYRGTATLENVLKSLFDPMGIEFDFIEQQVVLKKKKPKDSKKAVISGYVKDQLNGEAIIGATVSIDSLSIGVLTNAYGYYSFPIPEGEHKVTFSFIGYNPVSISVTGNRDVNYSIDLEEKPPVLEEIVITSDESVELEEVQLSKEKISAETVTEMPALFGEMDVVKSMEFVPGIKAHSDGSTFYYVRGGNRDQNLLMIDDAPVFNSSHLLGVFSTVIPDAINSIEIYKGDMPVSMGGRLSSVIDIRTKKGNDRRFEVWGNSTLISSKLGVEGPIKKGFSSFLVSGRVSRIKYLFDNGNDDLKKLNFYDLTGKLNFSLGPKDNIYISTYTGKDNYFVDNVGLEWENILGSLRWNHLFNDKLFMNATVAGSSYDYFLHTDVSTNTKWKSRIATITLKSDFTYFKKANNVWSFGLAINGYNFNPGNLTTDNPNVQPPLISIRNSAETVLYGGQEVKLTDRLGVRYGLRISSWSNQGGAFEFLFDENNSPMDTLFFDAGEDYIDFGNTEPRLGLNYELTPYSSLKFSYTRNVQNVHLITNSISPFTSLEVWLPSSYNIEPEIADLIVFGYQQQLKKSGLMLSAELYFKNMQNQIDYEPHAETLLNPLIESELRFGDAQAAGLELMARKELGRLRGWVGYTISRATRTFEDINEGKEFNSFYDRPHEINLVMGYDLTKRIKLGMNWTYYTGSPYSKPIGFFNYNGLEAPIYGEKNGSRLPDYHRMDVSATFRLNKNPESRFTHDLSFSIYNLYGRKNTLFINYGKVEDAEGEFRMPSNLLENNRLTTQSYLFRFTPSITYNFRFL
ncbi:TonB-dependent receptor [Fulvivirga lutea]|uniref:TonB-dependent receptor n=1 Tax=Fulvivirga lutea TaxID=2810512 RepID=A0A975A195_9BACT|nr:TonB-dependent receptor [Fulvivirga lutea]QSE98061.1 TonB-dependent receptor [Fulvivirga lutea]